MDISGSRSDELRVSAQAFEKIIDQVKPLVVSEIREILEKKQEKITALGRWMIPESCDILKAAGVSGLENPYTNLMAWCLWPEDRNLALTIQQAWLRSLDSPKLQQLATDLKQAEEPSVQFKTDDGIPDLVINYRDQKFLIVVEAKVEAMESDTLGSGMQTVRYLKAVRSKLDLPDDYRDAIVFMTRDLVNAKNPDAITTTYEAFVSALAGVLPYDDLGNELRAAYATVISHLLSHAAPGGVNRGEHIRSLMQGIKNLNKLSDEEVVRLGSFSRNL